MKDYKKVLRFARVSIREELRNVNLYVFLCIMFLVLQFCFSGIKGYLQEAEESMNLFELYIGFMSTRTSQMIYLVGILFLACGVVFFNTGAPYYLIRSGKAVWMKSQICYLFIMAAGYNVFLLISFWIACGGRITFQGKWSSAALTACQFSAKAIGIRPIISFSHGIMRYSPNTIGILALLLSVLLAVGVGLVMIAFQIKKRAVFGILGIATVWFLDVLIESISFPGIADYLSPFGLSRVYRLSLNGSGPTPVYAVAFWVSFLLLLTAIQIKYIEKIDFVKLE